MTPVSNITRATCHNHPQREAAARCVSCGRSFCRECVTALDRRMLCAPCYRERIAAKGKKKRDWFLLNAAGQFLVGIALLWLTAYFAGRILLAIPASMHEGTLWQRFMP